MSDPTTHRAAAADVPSSFSDLLDKSLARSKDAHDKMATIMEGMTEAFQEAFSCANKGSAEYGMKVLEIVRAHANAAFDAASESMAVKSPTDLVEVSTAQARKQFELTTAHMKELATLAQRVVNDTTAPIRTGMTEPFRIAG